MSAADLLSSGQSLHAWRKFHAARAPKPFVHAEMFQKTVYSDEHFDRSFSFYRKESQPQNQKKGTTMNPLTQFKKNHLLPLLIAPALVALTAAPALATPNCGVITSNLLYPGQPVDTAHAAHFPDGLLDLMCRQFPGVRQPWYLHTNIRGDSDVYVTQHTFQPGQHTGWHTHPGPSLITVVAGELTVYEADSPNCTPIVYHTGESFTDIGCGDVHLVRNEGNVQALDVAVQIVPAGAPRRIEADQPAACPVITCP
jgi:quercetin dioxygenase-like cupin family protein